MLDTVELATYNVRTFALYKVRTLYVCCAYGVRFVTHRQQMTERAVIILEKGLTQSDPLTWYKSEVKPQGRHAEKNKFSSGSFMTVMN